MMLRGKGGGVKRAGVKVNTASGVGARLYTLRGSETEGRHDSSVPLGCRFEVSYVTHYAPSNENWQ